MAFARKDTLGRHLFISIFKLNILNIINPKPLTRVEYNFTFVINTEHCIYCDIKSFYHEYLISHFTLWSLNLINNIFWEWWKQLEIICNLVIVIFFNDCIALLFIESLLGFRKKTSRQLPTQCQPCSRRRFHCQICLQGFTAVSWMIYMFNLKVIIFFSLWWMSLIKFCFFIETKLTKTYADSFLLPQQVWMWNLQKTVFMETHVEHSQRKVS